MHIAVSGRPSAMCVSEPSQTPSPSRTLHAGFPGPTRRIKMPAKKATPKLTIPAAILRVMEENGKPMTAKAICNEVVALGAGAGKTPAASCSAKLYIEAKKADGLFVRRAPQTFKLLVRSIVIGQIRVLHHPV